MKSTVVTALICLLALAAITACDSKEKDTGSKSTSLKGWSLSAPELSDEQEAEVFRQSRSAERDEKNQTEAPGVHSSCRFMSSMLVKAPRGIVSMTFDDGPDAQLTPYVLDVLKKYDIKATFFVKGDHAVRQPRILARAVQEGHLVGNHSWNHPNFWALPSEEEIVQVDETTNVIEKYMGQKKFFRYPYGNSSCDTNAYLHEENYGIVGWHIDTCDWGFDISSHLGRVTPKDARICEVQPQNTSNFVGHVLQQINANHGGVVLMHDVHRSTILQLETIVVALKKSGYQFRRIDDPVFKSSIR